MLTAITRSSASSQSSAIQSSSRQIAAQSIRPKIGPIAAASAVTRGLSLVSRLWMSTLTPTSPTRSPMTVGSSTSTSTRLAPWAAQSFAVARPMPPAAPVIRMRRPLRLKGDVSGNVTAKLHVFDAGRRQRAGRTPP